VTQFIDDFSNVAIQSVVDTVELITAALWHELGFPPQGKKVLPDGGFDSIGKVLGVIVDLKNWTMSIPADKVRKTVRAIEESLVVDWVPLKQLLSLFGLLVFCGQVLIPGRWKLAWVVQALRVAVKKGFAPMNSFWQQELVWWVTLLKSWNKVAMMVPRQWLIPAHANDRSPFTDASGGEAEGAAGAVFGRMAMAFSFSKEELQILPICDLEAMVAVLWLWFIGKTNPELLAGKRFESWCDNKSWVGAVNKHKSSCVTFAFLLDEVHHLQAKYSFDWRLEYVESERNVAADAVSRLDWERFYEFMQSVGYGKADIVWTSAHDLQESPRNSWSLQMRQRRLLEKRMHQQQSDPENRE
jgi:hypothetical protein